MPTASSWPESRFFSASDHGALAYVGGRGLGASQLAWFDRAGKQLATAGQPGRYMDVALSPDDQRVAVADQGEGDDVGSGADLWLLDLVRAIPSRFTFDPGYEQRPVWSPDGSRIVYSSNREGRHNLYQKASSGAGDDEPLLKSGETKYAYNWSADGRFLLYSASGPKTGQDLWFLPVSGDRKPAPFLQTAFNETARAVLAGRAVGGVCFRRVGQGPDLRAAVPAWPGREVADLDRRRLPAPLAAGWQGALLPLQGSKADGGPGKGRGGVSARPRPGAVSDPHEPVRRRCH